MGFIGGKDFSRKRLHTMDGAECSFRNFADERFDNAGLAFMLDRRYLASLVSHTLLFVHHGGTTESVK